LSPVDNQWKSTPDLNPHGDNLSDLAEYDTPSEVVLTSTAFRRIAGFGRSEDLLLFGIKFSLAASLFDVDTWTSPPVSVD
jgi:hypothetical protein